jgi:large subunit ribosomal protein L24e
MVVKRQCSFCAAEIEPGTGAMFVKRDGTVFHFCSSSCRKQQLHLHRVGHRFKWTRAHALKRAADHSSAQARSAAAAKEPAPSATPAKRRPKAAAPPAPAAAEPPKAAPPAKDAEAESPAESAKEAPTAKKPRAPRKKKAETADDDA